MTEQIQSRYFNFPLWKQSNSDKLRPFKGEDHTLIQTAKQLEDIIPDLLAQTKIGIDTEQSFQKTYEGFLCLIQISTKSINYLIDVVAIEDKTKISDCLGKVFSNDNIVKIFYAGSQDLLWLQRDYDLKINNFFDVRECANFLDKQADNSLIGLLSRHCDHHEDKQFKKVMQVSDWSQRPLQKSQLEYAALDAHFLINLRQTLLEIAFENVGLKRTLSFLDQMQQLTKKKYVTRQFDQKAAFESFFKLKEHSKSQQDNSQVHNHSFASLFKEDEVVQIVAAIFVRLLKLRDEYGKKMNLNPNNLLQDQQFFNIVVSAFDESSKDLKHLDSLEGCLNEQGSNQYIQDTKDQILDNINSWEQTSEKDKLMAETSKYLNTKKGGHSDKLERKEMRAQLFEEQFSIKKQPYGHCQILSPQGLKLCNCDEKKVNWYISKGLATLVSTSPSIIKLNFQPNGIPHEELAEELLLKENYFYSNKREIVCVVCGKPDHLAKYHIIPSVYRTNFPNKFKSHRSHDIVLLCVKCHQKAGKNSDALKDKLQQFYKIQKPPAQKQSTLRYQIKRIVASLKDYLKSKDDMSVETKQKCKSTIRNYYQEIISNEGLKEKFPQLFGEQVPLTKKSQKLKLEKQAETLFKSVEKLSSLYKEDATQNDKLLIGKAVVEKLDSEDKIVEFIKMWRQHFLDVNKPRFLPPAWDVNHKFSRDFGKDSIFYGGESKDTEEAQKEEDNQDKNSEEAEDEAEDTSA